MKTFTQFFIYTIIFCTLLGCASQGNMYSGEPIREPGKCYAKCLIGDKIEKEEALFPIYTGVGNAKKMVEEKTFTLSPSSTKWEKRKTNKNCISKNPEDCMTWCLVEIPAEYTTKLVVKDTNLTKEFVYQSFPVEYKVTKGGHTEWREVLCNNKITVELNQQIQLVLLQKGFYQGNLNGIWNSTTKSALVKFQKSNNLPIGSLDTETLDALGIDY